MSRPKKIDRRDLAPFVAAGLTEDVPLERVEEELPPAPVAPTDPRLDELEYVPGTRIPLPKFLVQDIESEVWVPSSGRVQRGARVILMPETLEAIKAGWICLRCLEPQDEAFPFRCTSPPEMGCDYRISDRQLRDVALEYEGEVELGPTPIERSE